MVAQYRKYRFPKRPYGNSVRIMPCQNVSRVRYYSFTRGNDTSSDCASVAPDGINVHTRNTEETNSSLHPYRCRKKVSPQPPGKPGPNGRRLNLAHKPRNLQSADRTKHLRLSPATKSKRISPQRSRTPQRPLTRFSIAPSVCLRF